jgi:hypothetical protein
MDAQWAPDERAGVDTCPTLFQEDTGQWVKRAIGWRIAEPLYRCTEKLPVSAMKHSVVTDEFQVSGWHSLCNYLLYEEHGEEQVKSEPQEWVPESEAHRLLLNIL